MSLEPIDARHPDRLHCCGAGIEAPAAPNRDALHCAAARLSIADGGPLHVDHDTPTELAQTLERAAAREPGRGIVYVSESTSEEQSYAALLDEARRILGGLRAMGLQPGDRMLLQCGCARDSLPAFWACVLGGVIPVPAAVAPSYETSNASTSKLEAAWRLLERPWILASGCLASRIETWAARNQLEPFRVANIDALRSSQPAPARHSAAADDLALFMLTSGSTGTPKAVMLSHRNLICRSLGSVQMNGFSHDDVSLNWMPLDHVAGLIYFHLRDVFIACRQIQAPTTLILEKALRWLDLIDQYRATVTFAPNFAYALVNAHADEIARRRWNLGSMRHVLNGAEAIVPRTARRFLELLIPHGLPATAMRPAWGMSETSSGVTYADTFRLDSTSDDDAFAEIGKPIPGFSMRIVDDENRIVREGQVGRLQVKGLTVTRGYYGADAGEHFTADGWFATGDLGTLRDGQLTLTGREKDAIIINSVNYHSHEIEGAVEELDGVQRSFAAACAVRMQSSDTDQLAIFFTPVSQEPATIQSLIARIRSHVLQRIGAAPAFVIPLPSDQIPKTEIGKIRRAELRRRLEAGEFVGAANGTDKRAACSLTERRVAAIWETVLGNAAFGCDESFFAVGGDSLRAIQVASRIQDAFQIDFPVRRLFEDASSVSVIAGMIDGCTHLRAAVAPIARTERTGTRPLSYLESPLWIVEQLQPGTPMLNVAIALRINGAFSADACARAIRGLVERHEVFRTGYTLAESGPVAVVKPLSECAPGWFAEIHCRGDEQAVNRAAADFALKPFDVTAPPLIRVGLFNGDSGALTLLLVFHQLVIDGWSLSILFKEFQALYLTAATGEAIALPPVALEYADFATWQQSQTGSPAWDEQLQFWKGQLANVNAPLRLSDAPAASEPWRGQTKTIRVAQSLCNRAELFNKREGVTPFMTLLAAFKAMLHFMSEADDILVGSPVAGRSRLETESMIGFFVNTVVLRTSLSGNPSFQELVHRVRRTALEAFTNQDVPFEVVLRTAHADCSRGANPFFRAWFGVIDPMEPFEAGGAAFVPSRFPLPTAQFDLSVFATSRNGVLELAVEHREHLFRPGFIDAFATAYLSVLRTVLADPSIRLSNLSELVTLPLEPSASPTLKPLHRSKRKCIALAA